MPTSARSSSTSEARGAAISETSHLASLTTGYRALVFGASGGIGAAMVEMLSDDPNCGEIFAGSRRPSIGSGKITSFPFDLTDEASLAKSVELASAKGPLDLVIVATGMLHDPAQQPEKSLRALTAEAMEKSFRINTVGPALIAKHALPKLRRDAKSVFCALSARVGSISDNRLGGWHSYRASKAALNMLVKTLAIELARTHPNAVCVTLHPGTVDTSLSKPFQGNVPDDRLFSPQRSAEALFCVVNDITPAQSGSLLGWDGKIIPF